MSRLWRSAKPHMHQSGSALECANYRKPQEFGGESCRCGAQAVYWRHDRAHLVASVGLLINTVLPLVSVDIGHCCQGSGSLRCQHPSAGPPVEKHRRVDLVWIGSLIPAAPRNGLAERESRWRLELALHVASSTSAQSIAYTNHLFSVTQEGQ